MRFVAGLVLFFKRLGVYSCVVSLTVFLSYAGFCNSVELGHVLLYGARAEGTISHVTHKRRGCIISFDLQGPQNQNMTLDVDVVSLGCIFYAEGEKLPLAYDPELLGEAMSLLQESAKSNTVILTAGGLLEQALGIFGVLAWAVAFAVAGWRWSPKRKAAMPQID